MRPRPSKRMAVTEPIRAAAAGPPSPEYPVSPMPATVVMTPVSASMRRTRPMVPSARKMSPPGPWATALTESMQALVAGPPSPLSHWKPVPAMVWMVPPSSTRRT